MTEIETIRMVCEETRAIFSSVLLQSNIKNVAGTCLHACLLLKLNLTKFFDCDVVIRGGDGDRDGGAYAIDGELHGHYWIEGKTKIGTNFVADITADQFGHDAIFLAAPDEARKRYICGDQKIVNDAVEELELSFGISVRNEGS